jgi:hypothetical protein
MELGGRNTDTLICATGISPPGADQGGTLKVDSGTTLNINDGVQRPDGTWTYMILGVKLDNFGTVNLNNANSYILITQSTGFTVPFRNENVARFNINTDFNFSTSYAITRLNTDSTNYTFQNVGTLTVNFSSGSYEMLLGCDNSGIVSLDSGTVGFDAGSVNDGHHTNANFANSGTLSFNGGDLNTDKKNIGTVDFNSGRVNVGDAATLQGQVYFYGGTWTLGSATQPTAQLTWLDYLEFDGGTLDVWGSNQTDYGAAIHVNNGLSSNLVFANNNTTVIAYVGTTNPTAGWNVISCTGTRLGMLAAGNSHRPFGWTHDAYGADSFGWAP